MCLKCVAVVSVFGFRRNSVALHRFCALLRVSDTRFIPVSAMLFHTLFHTMKQPGVFHPQRKKNHPYHLGVSLATVPKNLVSHTKDPLWGSADVA